MPSKWDQCTLGADCRGFYSALSKDTSPVRRPVGGRRRCSVGHLVVFVCLAAHGVFICCSLESTSLVDELWKHLNPPSADYIETDVIKDQSPAENGSCGQAVATFKPKTLY